MLPTLTKLLKPTWTSRAQSRIEVQIAPLWLKSAKFPASGIAAGRQSSRASRPGAMAGPASFRFTEAT